jgi:thioredoxin reductase (NADPH)
VPPKPVILVVDDENVVLSAVQRDLRPQYGSEYSIVGAGGGAEALEVVETLARTDQPLALALVDQRMPGVTGIDVLRATLELHPDAKRVLLTAYADTDVAITGINEVGLDFYITKPWDPPEERLYPILDDLLDDWQAGYRPVFDGIRIVGSPWSRETHELKNFLTRNQIPYRAIDLVSDEDMARELDLAKATVADLPLVTMPGGETLFRPSNVDVAGRMGLKTSAANEAYDLVVVGAGPSGLAAAVYGASEGLNTLLIEERAPGGQAGQSSRIENYLGFPKGISGADLARRAVTQAERFGVELLVPASVERVERKDPFRIVHLSDGSEVTTRSLIITSGVSYRQLAAEGIDEYTGRGVYYGTSRVEAMLHRDEPVFVIGGGNSAGQAALFLTGFTGRVSIVIRSDSLASTMSQYLISAIESSDAVSLIPGTQVATVSGSDRLETVRLRAIETGEENEHQAGAIFIFIGQKARTEWVAELVELNQRGFIVTGSDLSAPKGWNVDREPLPFETSVPGVFAAGDVRQGSIQRVAGAVGEGSATVRNVHRHLEDL